MAFDKVVDSQALDGALEAVADAIRGKTGSAATLTLAQMPGAISDIQTGSGGVELPELENPGEAGDLMAGKQLLDGAGVPVTGTFTIAPELAEQAALIDQIRAAVQGKAPEDLAAVLDEQAAAIAELKALLGGKASGGGGAEIPWLTREITEYSSDTLTELGPYALSGTRVTSLHLPALTTIAGYAFYNCTALADLALPALTEIPINGFREFTGIVKADFGALKRIGSNGFYKCTSLTTLIIRTGSVCTLAAGTVWTATPIQAGTGFIYVPRNLLDQYASAANWADLASQLRAIEDYPEITGGDNA